MRLESSERCAFGERKTSAFGLRLSGDVDGIENRSKTTAGPGDLETLLTTCTQYAKLLEV
jgi:hypothetical protein